MSYAGNTRYTKYRYEGPVEEFGKCVTCNWTSTTYAPSENKARSNFAYQFKKEFGLVPNTQIRLPGKITMLGRKD